MVRTKVMPSHGPAANVLNLMSKRSIARISYKTENKKAMLSQR